VGLGAAPFAPASTAAITEIREMNMSAEIDAVKTFALFISYQIPSFFPNLRAGSLP